jgi:hypothetical protein
MSEVQNAATPSKESQTTYVDDVESSSHVDSPDKPKLIDLLQGEIPAMPKGVYFVATKDAAESMYPVPSHKNFFGDVKVSNHNLFWTPHIS